MHVSIIVSRGSELDAHAYNESAGGAVMLTATGGDRASISIAFVCVADAERAARALLDAASQLRAPAPQGLVVEDVV